MISLLSRVLDRIKGATIGLTADLCLVGVSAALSITPGFFAPTNIYWNNSSSLPSVVNDASGLAVVTPANTAALNLAIAMAVAAGKKGVALTPATYHVVPTMTGADGVAAAVLINAPGDFTLDGQGSTLSLTAADVPHYAHIIMAQNAAISTTLRLRNWKIQYDSPPFAQATLTYKTACVANASGSATFQMIAGFAPKWAGVLRIDQYNPTTGLFIINVYSSYSPPSSSPLTMTNNGDGSYTLAFTGATQCRALASMTTRNYFSLESTQFGYDAIELLDVANVILDDVAIVDAAGDGVSVRGAGDVRVINGSGTYYAIGSRQTTNGGGFACIYCSGQLTADPTSHWVGTGDDTFFSAPYQINVVSASSTTNVTLSGRPKVNQGDTLQWIDGTGTKRATTVVSGISIRGGNTQVTLARAVTGVTSSATTWIVYNQSQAPSVIKIVGGEYGDSPTRGLFVDGLRVEVSQAHIQNTGAAAIYNEYGAENVGLVSASVSIHDNVVSNANYANDSAAGAIEVAGWIPGLTTANPTTPASAAAPANQIGAVDLRGNNCQNVGSSCEYVSAATTVSNLTNIHSTWYQLGAPPAMPQNGCPLYMSAMAFCNVGSVVNSGNSFLMAGSQIGVAGVAPSALASALPLKISGGMLNDTIPTSPTLNFFYNFLSAYETGNGVIARQSGRARYLDCYTSQGPGTNVTLTLSFRANFTQGGSPLQCQISESATHCSDHTDNQSVLAGQQVNFMEQLSGAGTLASNTQAWCGVVFDTP